MSYETLPPMPALFIGREDSLTSLSRCFSLQKKSASLRRAHQVVGVRGWPGVGKTALATAFAYKYRSDGNVLWASLGPKPNVLSLLAGWGRALDCDNLVKAATLAAAVDHLHQAVGSLDVLFVVDDVWDSAHLIPFQRSMGERGRLLFTTRVTAVADDFGDSGSVYVLPPLRPASALALLRKLAPAVVRKHPQECGRLASELEYLPLAIHVAGRLLRREDRFGWGVSDLIDELAKGAAIIEAVAPHDRADLERQTIPTVVALLRQSTDVLTPELRIRFAFLGPFAPRPASFTVDALSAVWATSDPRPIARELVGYGLLEPVGDRFQMHALLAHHARALLESLA